MKREGVVLFFIVWAVLFIKMTYSATLYCGVAAPDGTAVCTNSVFMDVTSGSHTNTCQCVWTIDCQQIGDYTRWAYSDNPTNWVQGSNTAQASHTHWGTTYADRQDNSVVYTCSCVTDNDCPVCQVCTQQGQCINAADNTDPKNECSPSWNSCDNLCVKRGGDGYCDGNGACDTNDAVANVAANNICSGGSEVSGVCASTWACTNAQNQDNAYNNGLFGYETQGYCDGFGNCDRSGSTREPDNQQSTCECEASGTQSTCSNGETDCWDSSQAECCGDDGTSDDWCDGTSYAACLDGTYRTDADNYQYVCECGGSTWIASGTGANSRCCGNVAGEDFESTSGEGNNCCYNGAVLSDGSRAAGNQLLCSNGLLYSCGASVGDDSGLSQIISNGDCTSREGYYCQQDDTWQTNIPSGCSGCTAGTECAFGLCVEGSCQNSCTQSMSGDRCSDDNSAYTDTASGICARTNSGSWACDKDEVAQQVDHYQDCYEVENSAPSSVIACDTDVAPSYSANGICSYSSGGANSGTVDCDTNEVCFDDTDYRSDCSNCYSSGADWDSCDYDVGTSYSADGICVSGGVCDNSGHACYDGAAYQNDCALCSDTNDCDILITDGVFTQTGHCCSNSCVQDNSLGIGASCCQNENCVSGICQAGVCVAGEGTACSTGNECAGVCIEGVCRSSCSNLYDGLNCSNDGTQYTNAGICTLQTGVGWDCDYTIAAYNDNDHLYSCADTASDYGEECDPDSLAGGCLSAGLCGGTNHDTCYNDYASGPNNAITSSSIFGTEAQVCANTYNGYYCDYIGDVSFIPGDYRCDGSQADCTLCDFSEATDESGNCESGCGANAAVDEQPQLARMVDEAVMELGYSDDITDLACCNAADNCVNNDVCFSSGNHSADVDGDGDTDYCDSGTWKDCFNNSDCAQWLLCDLSSHDCINPDGYILIRNLGTTGIEQTNQEFTSITTVYLNLNFTDNATRCRYANYDDDSQRPEAEFGGWTPWEPCVTSRIWRLTDSPGQKIVYYNIEFDDHNATYNDSIYYNYTGAGLDTTPPSAPIIVADDYTNQNQSIHVEWSGATDPESQILRIPLNYEYILYLQDGTILDTTITTELSRTSSGFNLPHNTRMYINVTAINSAKLKTKAANQPKQVVIDLRPPVLSNLNGSFKNLTDNQYYNLPLVASYVPAKQINFSWQFTDIDSGIVSAYSYLLTPQTGLYPDKVPEGDINDLENELSVNYDKLPSNEYRFYIWAKDIAGNWGGLSYLEALIDSTPPTMPEIQQKIHGSANLTVVWLASEDPETDIAYYMVNLTNSTGSVIDYAITNDLQHTFEGLGSGEYNATVGAVNGVGIWKWSDEGETITDFDPPEIKATPNRTVLTNSPVLRAWTNEQAACYYNLSEGKVLFLYTNTTYHETKLYNLNNGPYTYLITCVDRAENSRTVSINFTVDSTVSPSIILGPDPIITYEGTLTTFSISLYNTPILAGEERHKFELIIGGQEYDVSVFDIGTGFYNVTFRAPEDPDNYTLRLVMDSSLEHSAELVVRELVLTALYEEPSIAPSSTEHIIYYEATENRKIGLATDSDTTIRPSSDKLNITGVEISDNLMIFNTRIGLVNEKEKRISQQRFLEEINPSFGYSINDNYLVNFILRYDDYAIQSSMGDKISTGQYNTLIRRSTVDDKKIIKFLTTN